MILDLQSILCVLIQPTHAIHTMQQLQQGTTALAEQLNSRNKSQVPQGLTKDQTQLLLVQAEKLKADHQIERLKTNLRE